MQKTRNSRGIPEDFLPRKHAGLSDLKRGAQQTHLYQKYLYKGDIPEYPRPEFHLSHLKHDAHRDAIGQIWKDKGFKDPEGGSRDPHGLPLVWWSLAVGAEDIRSAETRLLEKIYPNRTEEQAVRQQSFLWKFATSPAFGEKSRFGSYRFTFLLQEVLTAYSQQFCSGAPPIMRVFKTSLYKQEIVYIVLVHSPANHELFSEYPLLPGDDPNAVCAYRDGRFIWRPEAMCETHRYELMQRREESLIDTEELFGFDRKFYVWDNVAIALHVENRKVLEFDCDLLRRNLTICKPVDGNLPFGSCFEDLESATTLVKRWWPDSDVPLEEEPPLMQRFMDKEPKEDPAEPKEEPEESEDPQQ